MIIYGKQPVLFIAKNFPKSIQEFIFAKDIDVPIYRELSKIAPVKRVDSQKAQAMARGGNHQGFFAEVDEISFSDSKEFKKCSFIVMLCNITDMGNIGAIVRNAYGLGADGIIISGIRDFKSAEALRTSSGSLYAIPVFNIFNPLDAINELKLVDFTICGATLDGKEIRDFSQYSKKVLILGNESYGLSNKIEKKLDLKVKIEMQNSFDSLNVASAAAILIDRMR